MELRLPTRCHTRSGGHAGRVVPLLVLASALLGCGSREDLIIGVENFTPQKRDDFDGPELDSSYWEVASHTFDPNLAWFSPTNAKIDHGMLVLSITADGSPASPLPNDVLKKYSAAEVRTQVSFLYGRFRARVRFAPGAGVVSAFWGFYDRYDASNGPQLDNQIVIESGIGKQADAPELRYSVKVPTHGPGSSERPTDFDPAAGFHIIGYDWTPAEVRFFVDGVSQLVVSGSAAAQLTQYQRLVMSAYPSASRRLGPFDPAILPVTAELDWIEISDYRGTRP